MYPSGLHPAEETKVTITSLQENQVNGEEVPIADDFTKDKRGFHFSRLCGR